MQRKSEEGFSYLYDSYAGALYSFINQIIPDVEICNNLLQEIFKNIWNNIDCYDPSKGRLFTWIIMIARNTAIDKKNGSDLQHSLKNQSTIIDLGFRKMNDEHRKLIDLAFYQGYSHEQIAEALDIHLWKVKTRIRSALIQLRTILS